MRHVRDGASCPGCGLANYEGLCPHCRGDQESYEAELVPPSPSSLAREDDCICHAAGPDEFGNYDQIVDPACPTCAPYAESERACPATHDSEEDPR